MRTRDVCAAEPDQIDSYIRNFSYATFNYRIEEIRQCTFTPAEQSPDKPKPIDYEFLGRAKLLQQVETYKTPKFGIRHADVGSCQASTGVVLLAIPRK